MMIKPKNIVEPVIKWSGSKRYVAPELSRHIAKQKRYIVYCPKIGLHI